MSRLNTIHVATPCPMKFSDMKGDERTRFCERCQQRVYNLSARTQAEVRDLVAAKEGKLCATFFRRADGTMLTRDCRGGFADAFHEKFRQTGDCGLVALLVMALLALGFAALVTLFGDSVRPLFGKSTTGLIVETSAPECPSKVRGSCPSR